MVAEADAQVQPAAIPGQQATQLIETRRSPARENNDGDRKRSTS